MRKIYITEEQLNEIINSDLMLSSKPSSEFVGDTISTTEPIDGVNYGDPMTTDDLAKEVPPGLLQRMTTRGAYNGPMV